MGDRTRSEGDALATPKALRLQRPSWKDSRLIIGVLLIAAATVGGTTLINHLDDSVEVYQASTELVPGQALTKSDVTTVKVRLEQVGGRYLLADQPLPTGRVVREVRKGELLPMTTVGSPSQVGRKAISVQVEPSFASTLVRGSTVDLWVSARKDGTGSAAYAQPQRIAGRIFVYRVPGGESGGLSVASSQSVAVQVLVPDDLVGKVIDAVNTEAKITLVATADSPMRGTP